MKTRAGSLPTRRMLLSGSVAALLWKRCEGMARAQATEDRPKTARDFGAIGDGETDDTAALQKAIDSSTGGIRLTSGLYKITKPIRVALDDVGYTSITGDGTATVIMAGEGPAFHIVGTHGGTAAPETVKENVWANQRMPLIDGFEIRGEHPKAQAS